MGNATSATITVVNNLTDQMTVNDFSDPPDMGKWTTKPKNCPKGTTDPAAKAIGKTCSMYGTGGWIKYGIPDGTVFTMRFEVPYGTSSPTFSCNASGPRAGNYKCDHTDFTSGYNPKTTVTVELATAATAVSPAEVEPKAVPAPPTMNGPTISHHGVSADSFAAFVKHMSEADGVKVTRKSATAVTLSGENTEIHVTHDPDTQAMQFQFAQVPGGMETYYWGHAHERMRLLTKA